MTPATSEESISVPVPSGRQKNRSPYTVLVRRAIIALKNKCGSSKNAISRYIVAHNSVKKNNCERRVGTAIKRLLRCGTISKNGRGLFQLSSAKRRGAKGRKRLRVKRRKGGRRRRRTRRRKGRKGRKGRKKRRKGRKGKKKGRKAKKGRKGRRRRRRRRVAKRSLRRRRGARRRRGRRGRRGVTKRRR